MVVTINYGFMKKVNVAILGAGRWGFNLIRNFLQHPLTNVQVIVDPNHHNLAILPERLDKLWQENILVTRDWQTVFKIPHIDAVVVATPATTHYDLIKAYLQSGYHVLAEKPLTIHPDESLELCRLAEQQQKILTVDHTYLFNPIVQQGEIVTKSGKLGDLRYGYAARTNLGPVRNDVDALWDLAIHDIAIFNYWLGETPTKVQATGNVWLQPNLSDLVWVKLVYPSGFVATIHLCWSNPDKQRKLSVVGSQGTLIFDELSSHPLTFYSGNFLHENNHFIPIEQHIEHIDCPPAEPLKLVVDHFITSVQKQQVSVISSGNVGADLVRILHYLSDSLNQGGVELFL
jgi:predicted dehydrogenase